MVYYDRVVNFLSKIQSLHSPLVIELNYIVIYIAYIYIVFHLPVLLRCTWHTLLHKFKVYSIMITYIMKWMYISCTYYMNPIAFGQPNYYSRDYILCNFLWKGTVQVHKMNVENLWAFLESIDCLWLLSMAE